MIAIAIERAIRPPIRTASRRKIALVPRNRALPRVEFVDPLDSSTYTESGLGDVVLGLTFYDVIESANGSLTSDLTGKVELPPADEAKGLGTGETDYSQAIREAKAALSRSLDERWRVQGYLVRLERRVARLG